MVGNPQRYRAALQQLENRHATAVAEAIAWLLSARLLVAAGCLLSLLLFLPFAAKTYSVPMLMTGASLYVVLVVPLATGFITIGHVFASLRLAVIRIHDAKTLRYWVKRMGNFFLGLHLLYGHLETIHPTSNQVLFFLLAEKVICPAQFMTCLYMLLFYTVLAYLHKSLTERKWSQLMQEQENSAAGFIRLTVAFIIVRLGKGAAMSMVLVMFSLQFDHLEPTSDYIVITAVYFLLTQFHGKPGVETVPVQAVRWVNVPFLEGLEDLYVPLAIHTVAELLAIWLIVMGLPTPTIWPLCLLVGYANIYVTGQHVIRRCWLPLSLELKEMDKFPRATRRQIAEKADGICAVCLDDMGMFSARITRCGHVFHGVCIRKCAKHYRQCPLCKQDL